MSPFILQVGLQGAVDFDRKATEVAEQIKKFMGLQSLKVSVIGNHAQFIISEHPQVYLGNRGDGTGDLAALKLSVSTADFFSKNPSLNFDWGNGHVGIIVSRGDGEFDISTPIYSGTLIVRNGKVVDGHIKEMHKKIDGFK